VAAARGHSAVMNALIKAGCNKDAADQNGRTPLDRAADNGHAALVDALIKAGCKNGK